MRSSLTTGTELISPGGELVPTVDLPVGDPGEGTRAGTFGHLATTT